MRSLFIEYQEENWNGVKECITIPIGCLEMNLLIDVVGIVELLKLGNHYIQSLYMRKIYTLDAFKSIKDDVVFSDDPMLRVRASIVDRNIWGCPSIGEIIYTLCINNMNIKRAIEILDIYVKYEGSAP